MSISGISATPPPTLGAGDPKPSTAGAKPQPQPQQASNERHIHIDKEAPTSNQVPKSSVDKTA